MFLFACNCLRPHEEAVGSALHYSRDHHWCTHTHTPPPPPPPPPEQQTPTEAVSVCRLQRPRASFAACFAKRIFRCLVLAQSLRHHFRVLRRLMVSARQGTSGCSTCSVVRLHLCVLSRLMVSARQGTTGRRSERQTVSAILTVGECEGRGSTRSVRPSVRPRVRQSVRPSKPTKKRRLLQPAFGRWFVQSLLRLARLFIVSLIGRLPMSCLWMLCAR